MHLSPDVSGGNTDALVMHHVTRPGTLPTRARVGCTALHSPSRQSATPWRPLPVVVRTFLTDSRRRLRRRAVARRRAPACPRSAAGRGAPALRHRIAEAGPLRQEGTGLDGPRPSDSEQILDQRRLDLRRRDQAQRHLNLLDGETPLPGSECSDLLVDLVEVTGRQGAYRSQHHTEELVLAFVRDNNGLPDGAPIELRC